MQNRRRGKQINYRCSEKEEKRLRRVARHHDCTIAALIRMLVKQEALRIKRAGDVVVGGVEPFGRSFGGGFR